MSGTSVGNGPEDEDGTLCDAFLVVEYVDIIICWGGGGLDTADTGQYVLINILLHCRPKDCERKTIKAYHGIHVSFTCKYSNRTSGTFFNYGEKTAADIK